MVKVGTLTSDAGIDTFVEDKGVLSPDGHEIADGALVLTFVDEALVLMFVDGALVLMFAEFADGNLALILEVSNGPDGGSSILQISMCSETLKLPFLFTWYPCSWSRGLIDWTRD